MKQLDYSGYHLVWEDQFKGNELDRQVWNVELHEPGWVNEEWQEYIDSKEVIKVRDGKLHLLPVCKEQEGGSKKYYSGRVSTQGKKEFVYGIFEARAKVPKGKGYLPAFWLMTGDEDTYGQWPRCGEIDIMEVLGHETDTLHGTIHYGIPHEQSSGEIQIENEQDFSEEFHTFAVEWEPGRIRWFVDGNCYYEETMWYANVEEKGRIAFPAPFNHEFYVILNLAIGGSWVGYPDETTSFENQEYVIDYVKVYQKKDKS